MTALLDLQLEAVLQRGDANLLESRDLALREMRIGEVVQRRPAPEAKRGREGLSRVRRPPVRLLLARLLNQTLEPGHVELLWLEPERIALGAGLHGCARAVREELSKLRDVAVERDRCRLGRCFAPDLV